MEVITNKNYEDEFYNLQGVRTKPVKGILIYEEAQKKLDVSDSGKLYKQKFYNYIPIVGPICATVYANFCLGKTKCLRNSDMMLFKNATKYVNLFSFLIWPLIFLLLWTLLTYVIVEFSAVQNVSITNFFNDSYVMNITSGSAGDYNNLWNEALINQLSIISINSVGDFFKYLSVLFSGLFFIFVFPLTYSNVFIISTAQINTNLIFILAFIVITIINPVNIFNSLLINSSKLRFVIVYEASSIYRYRSR